MVSTLEKVEIAFHTVELILNFLGLVLIIFGWIVPYRQSVKTQNKTRLNEIEFQKNMWKKELVDKQISLFYGPISALLREDNIIFHFVLDEMGRQHVFEDGHHKMSDLSQDDQKRWKHYVDYYKIPTQNKILKIIRENKHLIYKSEIPTSFDRYMKYALGWQFLDDQYRQGIPNYYEYYFVYNFPGDFTQYINETLVLLLKIQSELVGIKDYPTIAY